MDPSPFRAVASSTLLAGVRVVEISRHVAGAYCGRLLAQLGAEVTRVGPEIDLAGLPRTRHAMQQLLHDGKRNGETSGALEGESLQAALAQADVVIVESDGPASGSPAGDDEATYLDRLAESIVKRRAGLKADAIVIVLSACGLGNGREPGCGLTSSAWGAMSWAIGEPSREPLSPPFDIVDYQTGAHAAAATLVALLGGAGSARSPIDVASRDVVTHLVATLAKNYVAYGRPWQRDGRRPFKSGGIYPLGLFSCRDGIVALYCRSTDQWQGILHAMGDPAWSRAERFADPRTVAREHGDEADSHLLPWLAGLSKSQIMALGIEFGFPASPVQTVGEALANPQFSFRGSLQPYTLDDGTTLQVPVEPWRLHTVAEPRDLPGLPDLPDQRRASLTPKPWPVAAAPQRPPSALLKGLRVLDLSWVWSGPLVTSLLADVGAEVIKIEHPSRLDSLRQRGRPMQDGKDVPGPVEELNPWFNQLNHGKRSVVLDIKSAQGRAQLRALAATCDVVVENMRPGALAKLGLGYADFAAVNPSLVMLSMSLAGAAGPLSGMKGYAGIMTSMAGLEALVGYTEADDSQTVVGMAKTAMGDPNAAIHAVSVLMAALYRRKLSGDGLWIDLSQTDAVLSILPGPLLETQLYGQARVLGNRHPLHAPHGHFRCRGDAAWVALSVKTDAQWRRLQGVIDDAGLRRFAALGAAQRVEARADIEQAIEAWTSQYTREDIVDKLASAGITAAPLASYEEMSAAAWRRRRGLSLSVEHPFMGTQEVLVPPWRFGGESPGVAVPAPVLGADTDQVLGALAGGFGNPPTVNDMQDIGSHAAGSQGNVALPLSLIPSGDGRPWPALGRS